MRSATLVFQEVNNLVHLTIVRGKDIPTMSSGPQGDWNPPNPTMGSNTNKNKSQCSYSWRILKCQLSCLLSTNWSEHYNETVLPRKSHEILGLRIFSAADIFPGPLLRFAAKISASWQHWNKIKVEEKTTWRMHTLNSRHSYGKYTCALWVADNHKESTHAHFE
jgi:hypothetical protein